MGKGRFETHEVISELQAWVKRGGGAVKRSRQVMEQALKLMVMGEVSSSICCWEMGYV